MANSAVDVADMRDLVGLARHPLPNKYQDGTGEMLKDRVSGEHDLAKAEQEQKDGEDVVDTRDLVGFARHLLPARRNGKNVRKL